MDINYNGQSVKNLIHKLTKYQTLHARAQSQSSLKARVYEAKVNEYVEKLRSAGVKDASMVGGVKFDDLERATQAVSSALREAVKGKKDAYVAARDANKAGDSVPIDMGTLEQDVKALNESSQQTIKHLQDGVGKMVGLNLRAQMAMQQGVDAINDLKFNDMPKGSVPNLDDLNRVVAETKALRKETDASAGASDLDVITRNAKIALLKELINGDQITGESYREMVADDKAEIENGLIQGDNAIDQATIDKLNAPTVGAP